MTHNTFSGAAAQLLRLGIRARLGQMTGSRSPIEAFAQPPGDPGLFGAESQVWRVHAHFAAMMAGGLASLMVQALHPRALAAVWEHSDFHTKLKDRLGATAQFVAATTYGSQEMALGAIRRVNAIHAQVRGLDAHNRPYAANEPELIRWVHLVEVTSFLEAYQRLSCRPLSPGQADQYIEEMARIGHLLGAVDLPRTLGNTLQAIEAFRSELVCSDRTRQTVQTVRAFPADLPDLPYTRLLLRCANHLMPSWAVDMLGETEACGMDKHLTQTALALASAPIQWSLDQDGVAAVARRRVMTPCETPHACNPV